jgi:hypothetical protein
MLKSQFSLPFVNLFEGNFTSIFSNLVFDWNWCFDFPDNFIIGFDSNYCFTQI